MYQHLTKLLWTAAVVVIAVGAFGRDVLADNARHHRAVSASLTLWCGQDGLVLGDVLIEVRGGSLTVLQDVLTGRGCLDVILENPVVAVGLASLHVQEGVVVSTKSGKQEVGVVLGQTCQAGTMGIIQQKFCEFTRNHPIILDCCPHR